MRKFSVAIVLLLVTTLCVSCSQAFMDGFNQGINGGANSYAPASTSSLAHGTYKVTIFRVDNDLYRDQISGIIIKTEYCFIYAYYGEAVLIWEGPYSSDSKIVIGNETCRVKSVFR